jgi:type IV pilus assembly protein PilE
MTQLQPNPETDPMQRNFKGKAGQRVRGMTLIELMIVVGIVALLAAVALPSYNRQVQKSRRTDGHNILLRIAAEQERYYTNFNRYTANLNAAPPGGLGMVSSVSEHGYYVVTAAVGAGGQTFTLTGTPQNTQAADLCANLTLGNSDAKGYSGTEENGVCW